MDDYTGQHGWLYRTTWMRQHALITLP